MAKQIPAEFINQNGREMVIISVEDFEKLKAAYDREDALIMEIAQQILDKHIDAFRRLANESY